MPTPNEQLRRIFDLMLEASPADRAAILDRECGNDAAMSGRIEAMVAGAEDERFLSGPTVDRPATLLGNVTLTSIAELIEVPGTRIGPYKLLQLIGQGGFGSVFLAQQEGPISRKVALKIIKLGMDTRQVVARFEQERQALAMMDHPHIARVFDAGATETGRPYFVMELCAGDSITEYCDRHNLSISERLSLFVQVCEAVQHAHQRGLIHRDIKPSNVMVSTQDGRPHAKVIDFGIAKATAANLTEKTLFTENRQLIGTPEYMSPEQAEGSLDIDTRTDVYSLGVLLYELLTGNTPFDSKSLRSAAYAEIQRIIREVDPPMPSTRLRQSTDTIASVASRRNIEPKKLGTLVRGELDWIVMKALEKDRQRRYESPNALGFDIQRYLSGEAVNAAPPSRLYLVRKFVRRHKGPVTAAAAVGIALLAGIVAFAWQAKVSRGERDRAIKAEAQTAERAGELQRVSDFQFQMLSQVDPSAAGLRLTSDVRSRFDAALVKAGVPERERAAQSAAFSETWSRVNATDTAQALIKSSILAPALNAIDRQFKQEPALNAKLRSAISARYIELGLYDDALAAYEQVLGTRRRAFGDDDVETINAVLGKCNVLTLLGRSTEAEAILRPLVERQRARLGAESPVFLTAVEYLGQALFPQNKNAESEKYFRESLAGRRRVLGDDHEDTLMSMGDLSMVLRAEAKFAEAESLTRETLERRQRLFGDDNNYTLTSINNLGTIYVDEGRLKEAAASFQKAAQGRQRLLGEAHRDTIVSTNNLAVALGRLDRRGEAELIQRDLLERTRRILGPDHPDTLMVLSNLVTTLIKLGKLDEAEPLCRESLERRLRVFGANSTGAVTANNVMAFLLRRQNKNADAEPYLRAALDASWTAWGEDHPERLILLINMGSLTRERGRPAESEQFYREAVERCTRALGPEHPYSLLAVGGLSETLSGESKFAECVQLLSAAEPTFRKAASNSDQGDLRMLLRGLGEAHASLHEFPAAELKLKEAYTLFLAARGADSPGTQHCVQALVELYEAWDLAEPAAGHQTSASEWRTHLATPGTQPATAPTTTPHASAAAAVSMVKTVARRFCFFNNPVSTLPGANSMN